MNNQYASLAYPLRLDIFLGPLSSSVPPASPADLSSPPAPAASCCQSVFPRKLKTLLSMVIITWNRLEEVRADLPSALATIQPLTFAFPYD
ncbi:hypothetical protein GWI33_022960 [Rhynchophorus ferrugineus]|uniref:Uncharacterized protein n=1 Tax=Rhynchophorus ferrugineus TaxID=354439 RepID=A0A834HTT5_RHYFE|nr:hypothetical protein GWI33_022960 [Rhynchophorus ferrugineus]